MRILVLTHRLPYAPNRGDRNRAHHLLKALARRHEVHLVSLIHDEEEQQNLGALDGIVASTQGARVHRVRALLAAAAALPGSTPLTHAMLSSPELPPLLHRSLKEVRPDAVLAYCTGMARYAVAPPLNNIPYVLDMVDVDSEKWAAMGGQTTGPMGWVYRREGRVLRQFERAAVERAIATTVVSVRERELANKVLGMPDRVIVAENGVDTAFFSPPDPPPVTSDICFCGVFNYGPNEQAADWLATSVWPLVKATEPTARLWLVGMNPSKRVQALAREGSVEVTGAVPDVRPYLWKCAAAVAPLQVARGVQNKVIEATAAGLPNVVTPQVFDGLPDGVRPACVSATDARPFADAILALLRSRPEERRRIALQADLSKMTWDARLQPLVGLFERM